MHTLPHPHLPAHASSGHLLRAKALQDYLAAVHAALAAYREIPPVTLYVLDEAAWGRYSRYPYGFAFQRTGPAGVLEVFAPARYPERLLTRLAEVFLEAARAGARLPGPPRAFLDLTLAHEYAHAAAIAWRLRVRVRWIDEFIANYLYVLALAQQHPERYQSARAWATFTAHLTPTRTDLGGYERYPRKPLQDQLWFQGQFTAFAAHLIETDGDRLLRALLAQAPLKRSTIHRVLVQLEPRFRGWFARFGRLGA